MAFRDAACGGTKDRWSSEEDSAGARLNAVLTLETFDRFVFVLSVLEHYKNLDCSLLLHCTVQTVSVARTRALQAVAYARACRNLESDGPRVATHSAISRTR